MTYLHAASDRGVAPPHSGGDEPTIISSYLALLERGREAEAVAALEALAGVEVHGAELGQYVVTIEAASVGETYERATAITRLPCVTALNLVYCNFEDETLGASR
jgi:nitrate reductase NapD